MSMVHVMNVLYLCGVKVVNEPKLFSDMLLIWTNATQLLSNVIPKQICFHKKYVSHICIVLYKEQNFTLIHCKSKNNNDKEDDACCLYDV